MMNWRPPEIPPCKVCGNTGTFQDAHGSFCTYHYEQKWEELKKQREEVK